MLALFHFGVEIKSRELGKMIASYFGVDFSWKRKHTSEPNLPPSTPLQSPPYDIFWGLHKAALHVPPQKMSYRGRDSGGRWGDSASHLQWLSHNFTDRPWKPQYRCPCKRSVPPERKTDGTQRHINGVVSKNNKYDNVGFAGKTRPFWYDPVCVPPRDDELSEWCHISVSVSLRGGNTQSLSLSFVILLSLWWWLWLSLLLLLV